MKTLNTLFVLMTISGAAVARAGDFVYTPIASTGDFGALPVLGSNVSEISSPCMLENGQILFAARNDTQSIIYLADTSGIKIVHAFGPGGLPGSISMLRFKASPNGRCVFYRSENGQPDRWVAGGIDSAGNPRPIETVIEVPGMVLDTNAGINDQGVASVQTAVLFQGEYLKYWNAGVLSDIVPFGNNGFIGPPALDSNGQVYFKYQQAIFRFEGESSSLVVTPGDLGLTYVGVRYGLSPNQAIGAITGYEDLSKDVLFRYENGSFTLIDPALLSISSLTVNDLGWIAYQRLALFNNSIFVERRNGPEPVAQIGDRLLGSADAKVSWVINNSSRLMNNAGTIVFSTKMTDEVANKSGLVVFLANEAPACLADCDASGTLNIDDFICFQTLFALADPSADCDASGGLNIDDFICFQTLFALGC
jgi:hypothetical protein